MIYIFEKNRGVSIIITLMISLIIFYVSSLSFTAGGGKSSVAVIYHFTAFSYLSLFLLISLTKGKLNKSLIILGIILVIIYGITDEIHQLFVSGRFFSIKDILTDSFGSIITGLAYMNYIKE
ncbi:MAG: VanZ family protein [Nanoarchaeota archaeon]